MIHGDMFARSIPTARMRFRPLPEYSEALMPLSRSRSKAIFSLICRLRFWEAKFETCDRTAGRTLLIICIPLRCDAPVVAAPLLARPEPPSNVFMASPNLAGWFTIVTPAS